MPYDDWYEKHGNRAGVEPSWLKRMAQIENSEKATGCTGSYCGIMQLSKEEFRRYGGTSSFGRDGRFDPEQSIMAAANKMAQESRDFEAKYGRPATFNDVYLIHQQGDAGYAAHLANPDRPAWENMYSTGEGKQKGPGWAKLAIKLNMPGGVAQYGGVENVTSQMFTDAWAQKGLKGGAMADAHEPAGLPRIQAEDLPEGYVPAEGGEAEAAGLPSGAVDTGEGEGGKRTRAGRGAADAAMDEKSLLNQEDIEPYKPNIPPFKVPDLVPKFTGV
jgi:hypothetical protein